MFLINTLLLHIPLLALTHGQNDRQRNEYTRYAWAGGTFFQLCCCVSFLFWREIGFWFYILLMYLEYNTVVVLCQFFWFWREIVFGVTYALSVQYSCAVVSICWLWQEIILKMRTRFYKKILLGYFIMIRQPMCVFHKT